MHEALLRELNQQLPLHGLADRLRLVRDLVSGAVVLTTSFGLEDQVLTHVVAEAGLEIGLATLDTGRMFPEVYALWQQTEQRYGVTIRPAYPAAKDVQDFVQGHGINGFYDSIEARKACCAARKIAPLKRVLDWADLWVTGLRADQSQQRGQAEWAQYDEAFGLIKVSPLLDWSRDEVLAFARAHNVPINPLHEQGFVSIGCAPCTRAITEGEEERAGRWWWEHDSHKECGLHIGLDGRVQRAGTV